MLITLTILFLVFGNVFFLLGLSNVLRFFTQDEKDSSLLLGFVMAFLLLETTALLIGYNAANNRYKHLQVHATQGVWV
jgi:hypothetical protein